MPSKPKSAPKAGSKGTPKPRRGTGTKATPATAATLVIAEKQIAADRIAQILSGGRARRTGEGRFPIYRFEQEGREYRVVGLSGHVVEVDYPKEANRWYGIEPRELIDIDPIKKVPRTSKAIVDNLKRAAEGVDEIIIATDFDREGELIGKEAIELIQGTADAGRVTRARFSSLTEKEVKAAIAKPEKLDENLAAAGESRQVVDLAWGAVLTRFITLSARQRGQVLSVGRVQSPTLALLVDREKEILAFKPETYWLLRANLDQAPGFEAHHLGPFARDAAKTEAEAVKDDADEDAEDADESHIPADGFRDGAQAKQIFEAIRNAKEASVDAVERKPWTEAAPPPFNTTGFLRLAANRGLSAGRAMNLAEALYMRGFISYPRTDNTVYPPTEDLNAILESLHKAKTFDPELKILTQVRRPEPTRGKKTATDHPPIHPVEAARPGDVSPEEWKVYEIIVRRFLATLAKDAIGERMRIDLKIKDEPFRATGYRLLFAGWKDLETDRGSTERPLPELKAGQSVRVNEVMLDEKQTMPPKRYGQGRLITLMEKLGLGTKSTRHDIIEKLLGRHYVEGPKQLKPTAVGFAVADVLERYAEVVTKPEMTARLEEEMELVAEGKKKLHEVVQDSRDLLKQAVALLEKNRDKLGQELSTALEGQNQIGKCPRCGKGLRVIRGRTGKRFVGCTGYPDCRQTYPLPQRGGLQTMPDAQCDACGSPLVRILTAGRRPWEICLNMDCPKRAQRAQAVAEAAPTEAPAEE